MKVDNQVAFVTGGGNGIGRAAAIKLAGKGAKLFLVDFGKDENGRSTAKALADELNRLHRGNVAHGHVCDVSDADALAQAFSECHKVFGVPTIVFNNAGIMNPGGFLTEGDDHWRKLMLINTTAVMDGTKHAVLGMQKANLNGVIVNTASMAGLLATPGHADYAASKHAVVGLSRSLQYLGPDIRVNALCPSFTDTAMFRSGLGAGGVNPQDAGYAQAAMGQPLMDVDVVARGFMRLVEEDEHCGAVMRVTPQKGIDFQMYGRPKRSKM